ncbi:hypothetical protein [Paenibacillus lutrae]|uniref:Uncharacterized protein n=1 Tax=Paenibacillus lutrae TaxID=2078573 RepID=A0A7X3K1H4_9BACL|nr:hypothetical protein [Paenibacillus lutrae]MVP02137.1 hypothetical protein [Paenibacillus lutrae]
MPKTKKTHKSTIQIRDDLYKKLSEEADLKDKFIGQYAEEILSNHFAAENVDIVMVRADAAISERLKKFEDRLAAMWGKQGMDVAMILMTTMTLLSREVNRTKSPDQSDVDIEVLLKMMRPMAAKHFTGKRDIPE